MRRRICGVIRCILLMMFDAAGMYYLFHDWVAVAIGLFAICLWIFVLSEPISILRMGAIRLDKLDAMYKGRLQPGVDELLQRYHAYIGKEKSSIKVYVIPDDSEVNAYAFGIRKIGITTDALKTLDNRMAAAILSHELGHIQAWDVCVKRLLMINMLGIGMVLLAMQAMWIIIGFAIAMLFVWVFGSGFMGTWIGIGLVKAFAKLGKGVSSIILAVVQSFIAIADRQREFKADEFAAELGYGRELIFVLDRYVGETLPAKNLSDVLYATHPKTRKRVCRLEKKMNKGKLGVKEVCEGEW